MIRDVCGFLRMQIYRNIATWQLRRLSGRRKLSRSGPEITRMYQEGQALR
uniref:Uncharacterized protein n=1 Tax=Aegilops tauschii subsp. strangulata TaxID=200361 RepID=A0A453DA33_AEGTS